MAYSQYFSAKISQLVSNTSVVNTVAPTFGGVSSVTPNSDGSFTLNWSAATGSASSPFSYRIYVALGSVSAATLFVAANWVDTVPQGSLLGSIWQLGDNSTYFVNGQVYTFGVRAVSSVSVVDTNTTIITSTAIASGNITALLQSAAASIQSSAALIAASVL